MKNLRKPLSIILSLIMLMSMFAGINISAIAAAYGDWNYEILDDGTAQITGYSGSDTDIIIPDEINGHPVTSIDSCAFERNKLITSVKIGGNTASIGESAFIYCDNLTYAEVPENVTTIGEWAFGYSGSYSPFLGTTGNFIMSGEPGSAAEAYADKNGILFVKPGEDIPDPEPISAEDNLVYEIVDGKATITGIVSNPDMRGKLIIPDTLGGCPVTAIGAFAFLDCSYLTEIEMPDTITDIGDCAFYSCGALTTVTVSAGVTRIGGIFDYCGKLTNITIPASVTYIAGNSIGYTFSMYEETYIPINGQVTIYGTPGTAAQTYANENGITFIDVADKPVNEPTTDKKDEPTPPANDSDRITVNESNKFATVSMDGRKESLTAADFKASLGNENVKIVDKDGNELESNALVGTGAKVQLLNESGKVVSEYEVIVPSDVNGDGKTTAADARSALRASARLDDIVGVYSIAADMSGDEKITAADARAILRKSAGLE